MKFLQNVLAGFAVSLFGALPFGTINITAYYLFEAGGTVAMAQFICGVAMVEYLVVYALLKGTNWLAQHQRCLRTAEWGSVLLLVVMGVFLLSGDMGQASSGSGSSSLAYPPLFLGVFLNGVNVMQLPFWTGWNIFLTRKGHIHVGGFYKHGYLAGTSIGTSIGIMLFVSFFSVIADSGKRYATVDYVAPVACLLVAAYQVFKIFIKSFSKQLV